MTKRNCSCCGNPAGCGQPEGTEGTSALSRRQFIHSVGLGAVGVGLGGMLGAGEALGQVTSPRLGGLRTFPLTPPRVYRDAYLEAVAMPIGGIGTGTIWLNGQGQLGVWQIFNNFDEGRIPDSFLAIRTQTGGPPVVRALQTAAELGFPAMQSLTYQGGYPIARLRFQDPELPIGVLVEAFSPMIPTDAASSSLPCAVLRVTAQNTGPQPADVSLLATLQNATGTPDHGGVQGAAHPSYGNNRNALVQETGMHAAALGLRLEPPPSGAVVVRGPTGARVEALPLLWVERLSGLDEAAEGGPEEAALWGAMAGLAGTGGVVVIGEAKPTFLQAVDRVRRQMEGWDRLTVFEGFEGGNYDGWTVTGEAFGTKPSSGTTPGQQEVSGFLGQGLVNSFVPNDEPQGEMVSRTFTIERNYIGFLIGGGNHPNETCINLRVGGQVVRTATGKDNERLEPMSWDVREFRGREAELQIVDHNSGPWGHINIDHIVVADAPPERLLELRGPMYTVAMALGVRLGNLYGATLPEHTRAVVADQASAVALSTTAWTPRECTQCEHLEMDEGSSVLATDPQGRPLLIRAPLGKATALISLADGFPWDWARLLFLEAARGTGELPTDSQLVPTAPGLGTMALATTAADVTWDMGWTDAEQLAATFRDRGELAGTDDSGLSERGRTFNSALCTRFTLQPGAERTVSFVVSWHFPNVDRFGHYGNLYATRFPDATAVARHVCGNLEALWERTALYHQTLFESNLPEEFLAAASSQSVIFRGPTCWQSEEGYFAGFEGCYGCCPLNCTHVWNYAQSHGRLFPEIDRNMRHSDLITYLHPSGETSHRQHAVHSAFIDGHAATIEAAYRAYQLSPDRTFLESIFGNLVKAVDWMIEAIDADHDGVPSGQQWNTYDCAVSGANTFIGSQYLSALAAAERMADAMGQPEPAGRWRAVREAGMRNQDERLWNGEYYIQIPGEPPANDYNTGCHSDQLLGQWWAHMLDLGYLYPRERVRTALEAVMQHNFREKFAGFQQAPRRYVADDEGGLLICTWPRGGRPEQFTIYADEVWTGIEYATAGLMIYEGLMEPARQIVAMARSRYDGRLRPDANSGPGGNPFNDLECGKFYARAMSSWGLIIACQGLVLDGPQGVIGFRPRWQPEDHRSFYTASEGWGLFIQERGAGRQTDEIQVRHGRLRVRELVFEVPEGAGTLRAEVTAAGEAVPARVQREGDDVRLVLAQTAEIAEGHAIVAKLNW